MIKEIKNIAIPGSSGRPMLTDIFMDEEPGAKDLVIYAHGFNGFKDWANFDLIARQFAEAGFAFVKFNFSHNGTTSDAPEDFADLEAFGNNNYTKEINDLHFIIDWCLDPPNKYLAGRITPEMVNLVGHSRGGGIVILKASEDHRVQKIVTWASVSECKTPWSGWSDEAMEDWKNSGVAYYQNGRTKQQMPLYYQLHKDYELNKLRFNIHDAIASLEIPVLLCHGENDGSVSIDKCHQLKKWQPAAHVFTVAGDHVFDRKHPFTEDVLPISMQAVVDETVKFFNRR